MKSQRYSHYWYGIVLVMLKEYKDLKQEKTIQASIMVQAIEKAIEETVRIDPEQGPDKVRAIDLLYFSKTHDMAGVSLTLHVSYGTVKRWSNSFVKLVAKHAGYC